MSWALLTWKDHTMGTLDETHRELAAELGKVVAGEVRFDRVTRLLYSTDASNYQIEPIGVVLPRDVDDVCAVHQVAARMGIPLLPRGAGSSLAGQTVGYALVLDCSRHMNRLLTINGETRRVRVQPGMVLGILNRQLASLGLMVGPDPASADRATVGGCLGNNATGMHSILYGLFGDHVRGLEVVLADGTCLSLGAEVAPTPEVTRLQERIRHIAREYQDDIRTRYPKTWRTVAGYALNLINPEAPDLTRLFAGAEGTLGTVVAIELALVERPAQTCQVVLHFEELRAALELVPVILETGPSAIELMDKLLLDLTRAHPDYSRLLTFVEGDPSAVLVVEFYGEDERDLTGKVERLQNRLGQAGFRGAAVMATTRAQMDNVLKVRKAGLGLLMSMRGDLKPIPFIEDAAVPVEHLADYVSGVERIVAGEGLRMAVYAHASAGCLHIRPLLSLKTHDGLRRYRAIAEAVADLVMAYGGTTSGEHGEGLSRGEFSRKLFGPRLTEAFRQVKAAFDPLGLMNPGKVVDVGPMDDPALLRLGPLYTTPLEPQKLRLDWSHDGGFAAAVEMCNGAGVCRKEGMGVMCPSYMATRDEAHSTRGRANALRHAMTGALSPAGLADQQLYEVLDLCLSCKACKAECPSLVDMARLKAEFLAAYHDVHGVPWRSRLFGYIHRLNHLGSFAPTLSNAVLRSAPARWVLARLGVTPRRPLPLLAQQRFSTWYQQNCPQAASQHTLKAPILVADTYTEYNYPQLGMAVLRLADAVGAAVRVWGPRQLDCCGRPLISKGLLDEARRLAQRNVKRMAPAVEQGERFMLIEPSCAAAFRDEYPDLVPEALRPAAQRVAGAVITVEEWLAELVDAGHLASSMFSSAPDEILLHGHCYQRALWGTGAACRTLAVLPNSTVVEPDDGCCGMAGSFGYETEHYELSLRIAEQRLFPAINAAPHAVIVAAGVSCREQIAHGTGRQAVHPVELLSACLAVSTRSAQGD